VFISILNFLIYTDPVCKWGLDEIDLLTMPSAFLRGFGATPDSKLHRPSKFAMLQLTYFAKATFGSDMGVINGTEWGRLLMRNQFNSQPWGPLHDLQVEGVKQGTDLYFNKSQSLLSYSVTQNTDAMNTDRLSGLSGGPLKPMTPLGLYIQENDITTVFFGGVNTDQCVVSTRHSTSFNLCHHFADHLIVVWCYDRCILPGKFERASHRNFIS
jgi:hypothetical protein